MVNMNDSLKKKYKAFSEPVKWYNRPRMKNCAQYGGNISGNSGKSRTKKIVKGNFSGKTLGGMVRRMTNVVEKKIK